MPLLYRSGCAFSDHEQRKTYFNDIKHNYIETVKQLYLREIGPFCSCARAKIGKQDRPKTSNFFDKYWLNLFEKLNILLQNLKLIPI